MTPNDNAQKVDPMPTNNAKSLPRAAGLYWARFRAARDDPAVMRYDPEDAEVGYGWDCIGCDEIFGEAEVEVLSDEPLIFNVQKQVEGK